jgi:TRAP-type uncharacterized transport system substrate-binding protein
MKPVPHIEKACEESRVEARALFPDASPEPSLHDEAAAGMRRTLLVFLTEVPLLKFLAAAFILAAMPAFAGDLGGTFGGNAGAKETKVTVGCGVASKANCQLLPLLQAESYQNKVSLEPFTSAGTLESGLGVCLNKVDAAIGQRDGFHQIVRTSPSQNPNLPPDGCAGKLRQIGAPIYPYFGFLVGRADGPSSLDKMVNAVEKGKSVEIAAGEAGSGGQVTLDNILNALPAYKQVIHIRAMGADEALPALSRGEINAFFVMDAPKSPLVSQIKEALDERKKPLYQFMAVDLPRNFFTSPSVQGWGNSPLYYPVDIKIPGWLWSSHISTIATDAVMVVSTSYYERNRPVAGILAGSIDRSQATVRAALEVPADWKPVRK